MVMAWLMMFVMVSIRPAPAVARPFMGMVMVIFMPWLKVVSMNIPSSGSNQDTPEVVPSWMAHHQGMSLLAACNSLTDGAIQKLFHSEPAICATELLLHERLLPVDNTINHAKNRTAR